MNRLLCIGVLALVSVVDNAENSYSWEEARALPSV